MKGTPSIAAYNGVLKDAVPCWSVRPGALTVLEPLADCMGVWLVILSINGLEMAPCWASETTLGQLIGVSRYTVRRRLKKLRGVPGLLFELPRGRDWKNGRIRPAARWATDPATADRLKQILSGWRLAAIALEAGLDSNWTEAANNDLRAHLLAMDTLGRQMRAALGDPCAVVPQYAGGNGREGTGLKGKRGGEGKVKDREERSKIKRARAG